MDKDTAREYLTDPQNKKLSEIGEAVDVLYEDYSSYEAMARAFQKVGGSTLSTRRRIFQLPKGIRWKVDEGQISITNALQIARLRDENAQWMLAFVIVEEQLEIDVCSNVVNRVLKYDDSISDALSASAGVQCDKVTSLLLPLGFDIRLAIAQQAWNRSQELQDYCYDQICKDPDAAARELVCKYRALLSQLDEAMSQLLESHCSKLESLILKMDL